MTVRGWTLAVGMALGLLPAQAPQDASIVRCGIQMRNVTLHVADGVVLSVRALDGELVGHTPGVPPIFDDQRSYTLRLRTADLAIDPASLTTLLEQQAFGAHDSPIRGVRLTIEKGALQVRGTLHKGVSAPFTMTAVVSAADDGAMRLHAEKLKVIGVPVKGLLDLLRIDVADLMKAPAGSGIRADGDDLLIDTARLLPPPRLEGRLQHAAIAGPRLALRLIGPASPPPRPRTLPVPRARNYVYFFGGSIRFGKLTMTDADMQLIDANPADPFDFYPARYEKQLLAGYSRNTARKGLQVHLPDYARVAASERPLAPPQR
jgi:hypothetical protein